MDTWQPHMEAVETNMSVIVLDNCVSDLDFLFSYLFINAIVYIDPYSVRQ